MKKKILNKTILVSLPVYLLIIFLIFVLYRYVYYDFKQVNDIVKEVNDYNYDYIYNNLYYKNNIDKKDYDFVIRNTFDKDRLINIYNKYYKDKYSEDKFLLKYYYGNYEIDSNSIKTVEKGKNSLFKNKDVYLYSIDVKNSNISVLVNTTFVTNNGFDIILDNKNIKCLEVCSIMYLTSGNHEIYFKDFNNEYYALVNIKDSYKMINVFDLDLVKIS